MFFRTPRGVLGCKGLNWVKYVLCKVNAQYKTRTLSSAISPPRRNLFHNRLEGDGTSRTRIHFCLMFYPLFLYRILIFMVQKRNYNGREKICKIGVSGENWIERNPPFKCFSFFCCWGLLLGGGLPEPDLIS